ncbi:hypothetical protein [Calorimonas adulescens]|uniref:hypothetical protein n=1 Tax=Calorimonas adulescens TaxID=2606906 RepID=UPI001EEFF774|nr:hypothetical protein [Calorimonas adulescens]
MQLSPEHVEKMKKEKTDGWYEELFDVRYQPDEKTVTENIAFVKVHDEKHLTVGFPQRIVTWEELLDRLQVKLWVYPDRLEVRGIVPIEDIANPKCCCLKRCFRLLKGRFL